MNNWKTESETAALTGYTRQTLRNWRLGVNTGKYKYDRKLIEGVDWVKVGASVMFTDTFFNKLHNKELNNGKQKN